MQITDIQNTNDKITRLYVVNVEFQSCKLHIFRVQIKILRSNNLRIDILRITNQDFIH